MDRRQVLAGCGFLGAVGLVGSKFETPFHGFLDDEADVSVQDLPVGTANAQSDLLHELVTGNANFALDFHSYMAAEEGGNQFFSPYSLSVAFAMAYAGARGTTRAEMEEALHFTRGEETHEAVAELDDTLESREDTPQGVEDFQLTVANALWGQEDYQFAEGFTQTMDEHYGTGLRRADFQNAPEDERVRINEWVAEQTQDEIRDLLPQDALTTRTVLVITNAIYFLASWKIQFDEADTEDGTFTSRDGSESTVPFMHRDEMEAHHASIPGADAVELRYEGDMLSMVLLLPDNGEFETFDRELGAEQVFGLFDRLEPSMGTLALPRFEFESEAQLKAVMSDLGMPSAFRLGDADFSGMVPAEEADLFIDDGYHQTFVSVDEQGTEAAGTTGLSKEEDRRTDWGELRFDRPFLFFIRDRPTDAILFVGRVVDAGAAQGV